jgi:hypothetical protein
MIDRLERSPRLQLDQVAWLELHRHATPEMEKASTPVRGARPAQEHQLVSIRVVVDTLMVSGYRAATAQATGRDRAHSL